MFGGRAPGLIAALAVFTAILTGCADTVEWQEEVRLRNGRILVVQQKRRCAGGDAIAATQATCVASEAWLTFKLAEFSPANIVWHERLNPMVLNVHQGRLYVVGYPQHPSEFRDYGGTNPPYIGFQWKEGRWERIPFAQIPRDIYDGNLLIESIPKTRTGYLLLQQKDGPDENGDPRYEPHLRRIDPAYVKPLL